MSSFVKPSEGYFDKSYSNTLTESYTLSLLIDMQGLVFTIYHHDTNKYIALQSFVLHENDQSNELLNNFNSVMSELNWADVSFRSVNIIYCNNQSTLVPKSLFDESKPELYLNFNHPVKEKDAIHYNILKSTQSVNIFSMPGELEKRLKEVWPKCLIHHFSSVLIESLGINFKNKTDDNKLFVNLRSDSFDVVYFNENKLHFYNSFRYKTAEDFIYFLLSAFELLDLNPEEATVILMGEIDKQDDNYHMMYGYIRHIEFIERNDTFGYSNVLGDNSPQRHHVLFNVLQCE